MKNEKNSNNLYDRHIFCCVNKKGNPVQNNCCAGKGSEEKFEYLKQKVDQLNSDMKIRVNKAGCLGRCKLGKVLVIYPEGVWYHYDTEQDIDEIVNTHIVENNILHRLKI